MQRVELVTQLREYVSRELLHGDDRGLDAHTPLLEWGVIDSLSMVALLAFVEERFGVRVPDEKVRPEHFRSLDDLASLLLHLRAPASGA